MNVVVGPTVPVGEIVKVGVKVMVGVKVTVAVMVIVAVGVIVGVGGVPVTEKNPLTFQVSPANNCTSYCPGNQSAPGSVHSVKPNPPEAPFHGNDSIQTISPSLNHNEDHCELVIIWS